LYLRVVQSDVEWQRFVDCIVVPETWFFRVPEQFADLIRYAREHLGGRRPLRVLSLPCSTGEEPYSIAASLLDAGYGPSEFDVLGIDVSERAIAHGRQARYRPQTLRGGDYLHWFEADADCLRPIAQVRRSVRLRLGNVLHPGLFEAHERFDVVFCRNLLIYLDNDSRRRVIDQILQVLEPGGLVLAGQAEALASMDRRLQPAAGFGALSYVRAAESLTVRVPAPPPPVRQKLTPVPSQPAKATALPPPKPPTKHWQQAQQYADAGQIDQARASCQALLSEQPESARGWLLLGTLEMAEQRWEAADAALTRASYLDRTLREALVYRVALAERLRQPQVAAQLRARLQRLDQEDVAS
jgi:chemotaxis protein methyltransferase WspC